MKLIMVSECSMSRCSMRRCWQKGIFRRDTRLTVLLTYWTKPVREDEYLLDSRPQILDALNQEANTLLGEVQALETEISLRKKGFLGTYFFSSQEH